MAEAAAAAGDPSTASNPTNAGANSPAANPGGGNAPGANPDGGGSSAASSGGQPPQRESAPYRPEGLPDHFVGKDERETLDKVFKAFDGYRRADAERGAVPKAPTEYKLEFGEKVKPYLSNLDKDPIYAETLKIAHAAGLTDKQFNKFLPPLLEHFVDGGLVAQPIDAQEHLMSLAPPEAEGLDAAGKKAAAERRVADNIAWVDGIKTQGAMPEHVADYLAATLADNAQAHHLVEWLRGNDREPRPALGGKGGGSAPTEAELERRNNDPRNNPNDPKFDRAFAAETDRMFQRFYGA